MTLRAFRPAVAVAAALLAGSVLLTGCGDTGDAGGDGARAASDGSRRDAAQKDAGSGGQRAADPSAAPREEGDGGGGRRADVADAPRIAPEHVIRTASVTVVTKDVPGRLAEARTAVRSAGGHVADEETDQDPSGDRRSRVTLKVPPEEYEDVLTDLSGLGKLVERKVEAQDVTDQVVDVESRIETQQASVARVRKLMDRATKLTDVVTLESELSTRQAELESLQARLESLEDRSGMATVTLLLREPGGSGGEEKDDDGTTVGDALAGGWHAFVAMLRWIVIVLGAALPFVAALVLLALLWRVLRGRLPEGLRSPMRRSPATPPPPVTAPAPLGTSEAGEAAPDRP